MKILALPQLALAALLAAASAPASRAQETATPAETIRDEAKPAPSEPPGAPPRMPPRTAPGFSALGNLGLFPTLVPTVTYGGWIAPGRHPVQVGQERLTLQVPVFHDDVDAVSLSAGGTWLGFGEPQPLSGSGIRLGSDLWKLELGGSYSRKLERGKLVGGGISFGSASDRPFSDPSVTTIGANGYYSWESSASSRWILTLFFSNNNPIINYVPIPGFVYLYHSPKLIGMFGFPFNTVTWIPVFPLSLTLSVFGPQIRSELGFGIPGRLQAFSSFDWGSQSYLRKDRPEPKDRVYFEEKRVVPLGVRFALFEKLRAEASVGYAFDRALYEGSHFRNKDNGQAAFDASWYAAWNVRAEL